MVLGREKTELSTDTTRIGFVADFVEACEVVVVVVVVVVGVEVDEAVLTIFCALFAVLN